MKNFLLQSENFDSNLLKMYFVALVFLLHIYMIMSAGADVFQDVGENQMIKLKSTILCLFIEFCFSQVPGYCFYCL